MSLFPLTHRDRLTSENSKVQTSAIVDELDGLVAQVSAWALVNHNEDGTHNTLTTSGLSMVPVGALMQWVLDTIPTNWILCDGRALSRAEFPKLFAVYGISQGAGDGSTTFNIPNQFHTIILAA